MKSTHAEMFFGVSAALVRGQLRERLAPDISEGNGHIISDRRPKRLHCKPAGKGRTCARSESIERPKLRHSLPEESAHRLHVPMNCFIHKLLLEPALLIYCPNVLAMPPREGSSSEMEKSKGRTPKAVGRLETNENGMKWMT